MIWRDTLLDLLEQALVLWMKSENAPNPALLPAAHAEIVAQALALFRDSDFVVNARSDRLAVQLGISKRTLFLAF